MGKIVQMKYQLRNMIGALLFFIITCSCFAVQKGNERNQYTYELHYSSPSEDDWMNALPIGNGRLGAMIFGGVKEERIMLNENTLWSGWYDKNNNLNTAPHALAEIRQKIKVGKASEIQETAVEKILSPKGYGEKDFGSYQSFCDVIIRTESRDGVLRNYRRDLDLSTGIAQVQYFIGDVKYTREYFCSYPDQVIVMKLTSDQESGWNGSISFRSLHQNCKIVADGNRLVIRGQVDVGNDKYEGLKFEAQLLVDADGGHIEVQGSELNIRGADSVVIKVAGATNYRMSYPDYYGENPSVKNTRTLERIGSKNYQELKQTHTEDFSNLMNRVSLQLKQDTSYCHLPIDERLANYRQTRDDRQLETLLFQYGRYLLVSSSRPGGLPANLQGLWNNTNNPPWNCDYHLNINLQMNYWPAEVTNLSECHKPLIEWIDDLRKAGEKTAKVHFGSNGWVCSHTCNIWGFTAPGSQRGVHMFEPQSAAWIALHALEHFRFTNDKQFLSEKAWPILKGAAEFWLDNLQEYPGGVLVSSPSYSPEHGPLTHGAYFDQQVIWELFTGIIEAGVHLPSEKQFISTITEARTKLWPLKIGKYGQLCEWMDNDLLEEGDSKAYTNVLKNRHRHISHLMALYPGHQITVEHTPELAKAAEKSLDLRGDGGTGWSKAWKISCRARLKDGNHAWKLASEHLAHNMYNNLFDKCPPFQIDGNFGYTAGVAEMLLQSHNNEIELLPALPEVWESGMVAGLRARGDITIDIKWEKGRLISATLRSQQAKECMVRYSGKKVTVKLDAGETFEYKPE
ncbi:glycoside hydrolase family 95 protein [uncultured Sunxiuqinia sp.]|uniref:glycoside hydrolase family 95 protein n=1 Tax=uncultured Sunxiuqinia sp. TaxID=1573825 RepID=UPI002629BBF5|nr:glycoside hydrolase family 95 protein [uncultured Sunxiuqinia sp.]